MLRDSSKTGVNPELRKVVVFRFSRGSIFSTDTLDKGVDSIYSVHTLDNG